MAGTKNQEDEMMDYVIHDDTTGETWTYSASNELIDQVLQETGFALLDGGLRAWKSNTQTPLPSKGRVEIHIPRIEINFSYSTHRRNENKVRL